jgi:hypothetical protein
MDRKSKPIKRELELLNKRLKDRDINLDEPDFDIIEFLKKNIEDEMKNNKNK